VFATYTVEFAPQLRKKHRKPDVPVAVVQYIFTHKQYTEQHDETEYTDWNICVHNNKNT
jgi:hypothetical protein